MQYVKIKQAILDQIEAGTLAARQKLPSERQLAESFSTTRVTLREALSLLESEGAIYREDRRGWFIAPEPLRYDPSKALPFVQLTDDQQREGSWQILSVKNSLATKTATRLLELAPFSKAHAIEQIRYLEKRPVCYVNSYLLPDYVSPIEGSEEDVLLTELEKQFPLILETVTYRLAVKSLQGNVAQLLRATEGTPCLVIERRFIDKQQRIIRADVEYWRHDVVVIEG